MAAPSDPDPNPNPPGGTSANGPASNFARPATGALTPNPPPDNTANVASTAPLSQEERQARSQRLASRLKKSAKRLAKRRDEIAGHRRWLYNSSSSSPNPQSALMNRLGVGASKSSDDRNAKKSLSAPDTAIEEDTAVSPPEEDSVSTNSANPSQPAGKDPALDYRDPTSTVHDDPKLDSEDDTDEEQLLEPSEPEEDKLFDPMVSPFAGDATVQNLFSLFAGHQSLESRMETALTIRTRPQDAHESLSTDTTMTVAPSYSDEELFDAFKQRETSHLDHQIKMLEALQHSWETACKFAADRLELDIRSAGPDTSRLANAMDDIVCLARGTLEEIITFIREYHSKRLQCYDRSLRQLAAKTSQRDFREGKKLLFEDVQRLTEDFCQRLDKMKNQFIIYGKEWAENRPLCRKVLQMKCWKGFDITQMMFDSPAKDIFADSQAWQAAYDAEYMTSLEVESFEDDTNSHECFKHSYASVFPPDYIPPVPLTDDDTMQVDYDLLVSPPVQLALTASQDAVNEET